VLSVSLSSSASPTVKELPCCFLLLDSCHALVLGASVTEILSIGVQYQGSVRLVVWWLMMEQCLNLSDKFSWSSGHP
jgi:hypothetical protein